MSLFAQHIDLHMHSTASDGTVAPSQLPALAKKAGLTAIALTDHDTTAGHGACHRACKKAGVEFVPGVEFSCKRGAERGRLHMLGYFIDGGHAAIEAICAELNEARESRAPEMVAALQEIGVDVTLDEIRRVAAGAPIGRPHMASVLVTKGYAKSINDAFKKYLGLGAPAYRRKDTLDADRAIDAIHAAGGLAVLAHPIQLRYQDADHLESIVRALVDVGLDGLEIWHPDHSAANVRTYADLSERYALLKTGGSDFHGDRKDLTLNSQKVSPAVLDTMKQALARS